MDPENRKTEDEGGQELSPETVREIENSAFDLDDKVSILLVKAGLKPTALLYLETLGGKEEVSEEQIIACKKLLQNLGPFSEGRHFDEDHKLKSGGTAKTEAVEFLVGNTPENLQRLKLAVENNNAYETGLALGYCKTAVDAYCGTGELLDESTLWGEEWAREAMTFKPCKLSAEHFKEELEYYQKWADYVKRTSPVLYKKMMGISK